MENIDSKNEVLQRISELREKLVDLSNKNNFLNYKDSNNSIPIIDVDFYELFYKLIIEKETFSITNELSEKDVNKLLEDDSVSRRDKRKFKKVLKRITEFKDNSDEYYSQNGLITSPFPKFFIRNSEPVLNSPITNSQLNKRLGIISSKYTQSRRDKGISNLFLAMGFLEYNDALNKKDFFKAPLILVPVMIEKNKETYEISINSEEEIRLNKSLKLKLKDNNFDLPLSEIRSGDDMNNYFTKLNEIIPNDWSIKSHVSLGLFNFRKLTLYDDLNIENWSDEALNELNYYFSDTEYQNVKSFDDSDLDRTLDVKNSFNVLDADSSQIGVIEEAKLGNNLVVEGPPGTGKSQTIVNLIAEILANKKTVLFVSEKMGALDVVKKRLDDVGLGFACLELHSNNSSGRGFLEEINKTMNRSFDDLIYNENDISSKINRLQDLKNKLNSYTFNVHNEFNNSGITPYYLMGLKERNLQEIENNNEDLKIFNMDNLQKYNTTDYKDLFSNVSTISSFYKNKIGNVSKHKFKEISTVQLSDSEFSKIVNLIPITQDALSKLISLSEQLNEEYGIKKLTNLNNYEAHVNKIKIIEENPIVMGDDEEILIEYINALDIFQKKSKEYGSIEEIETKLVQLAKDTKNELTSFIDRARNVKKDIESLNSLIDQFKQEFYSHGIKSLNSIVEVNSSINKLDVLDKYPALIDNEAELNSFIQDVQTYQNKYSQKSPESLLTSMEKLSKNSVYSTLNIFNRLIPYESSVLELSDYLNKFSSLKSEIGLNSFNKTFELTQDINKLEVLQKQPVLIKNMSEMEVFIKEFNHGHEKYSNLSFDEYKKEFNNEIIEIQDEIKDDLTEYLELESILPTIAEEIDNILDKNDELVGLVDSKKITRLNEIDRHINDMEIILKNPRYINKNEIEQINYNIKIITDVQNDEKYTKLTVDELKTIKDSYVNVESELSNFNFTKDVLMIDFNTLKQDLADIKEKLLASPVKNAFLVNDLKLKVIEFEEDKDKIIKIVSNYAELKGELRSYYEYNAPTDDDLILNDYYNLLNIQEQFLNLKIKLTNYHIRSNRESYDSIESLESVLNILMQLKNRYTNSCNQINIILPDTKESDIISNLVDLELKLNDINNMESINKQMKELFPLSYIGFSTSLDDLYAEYEDNLKFTELVNEGYFDKNILNIIDDMDMIKYQDIIQELKQSKSRVYYYINLINNSFDLKNSFLSLKEVFKVDLNIFSEYCDDLLDEISESNDLFQYEDNYQIDEIDKLIEKFDKVLLLENIESLVNLTRFKDKLNYYQNEFEALVEFNSFDEFKNNKSIIDNYYADLWDGVNTPIDELNERYANHKEFSKLYDNKFFSKEVIEFLNNSQDDIKNKLNEFKTLCGILNKKINSLNDELVFYDTLPKDLSFEKLLIKNNEIIDILSKVKDQNNIVSKFDLDNLVNYNEFNLKSNQAIEEIYSKLSVVCKDEDINKFNISFDLVDNELKEINELNIKYQNIITLRDSINSREDIFNNHFVSKEEKFNIWEGPLTSVDDLKIKVKKDEIFSKLYHDGFFTEKTLKLIKDNPLAFDGFLPKLKSKFEEITKYITDLNSINILYYSSKEELSKVSFDDIVKKNNNALTVFDNMFEQYDKIKLPDEFNLEITNSNISLFENLINSEYITQINNQSTLNNYLSSQKINLGKLNELYNLKETFDGIEVESKYFRNVWNGYETSVDDLKNQLEVNREYNQLLEDGFFTPKIKEVIQSNEEDTSLIDDSNSQFMELYNTVDSQIDLIQNIIENFKRINQIYDPSEKLYLQNSISDLYDDMTYFKDNLSDLKEWRMFQKYCSEYDNSYTHEFIESLNRDEIPADILETTFNYNFANNMLNYIKSENKIVGLFDADTYNNFVDEFKNLDKEVLELNRLRVIHSLKNSRIVSFEGADKDPEMGKKYRAHKYLMEQLVLKRSTKSIRDILKDSIDIIKTIKPVFMMSPMSVAQYLQSDKFESYFDYVIFDEASQVKIEDSISTLLRGKTKVVIGDTKQLPPTTFFEKDQIDGEGYKNIESILHLCKSKFKIKSLRWHYRSKHDSLISVSNEEFYDNNLLVFPSANIESEELGLKLQYCPDTIYNRGTTKDNKLEAEKIVDYAIEHVEKYGFEKSLGVATFSEAQKNAILDALNKRLKDNEKLIKYFNPIGSRAFFVKNIESIQGDERDVILISVGYGYDKNNKLSTNFGPINKEGGERRLNVLMTRAKEKMVVFSNFKSGDMPDNVNVAKGVKTLKTLLYYAENREFPKNIQTTAHKLSIFEESIYNFLTSKGFKVEKQVGCEGYRVDLAIIDDKNPNEYLMAIECDGANYNNSNVTRDRERLHQEVLEKLGWNYYRLWANDWVTYREDAQNALINAINQSIETKYETKEDTILVDDAGVNVDIDISDDDILELLFDDLEEI